MSIWANATRPVVNTATTIISPVEIGRSPLTMASNQTQPAEDV
jgi:hypothetical protein